MKLIFGGYANGRTAYAMQNYQLTESDCFDAAAEPLARWNGQRLILHAEQLVNPWLEQGKEPCTEILHGWNGGRMQCSSRRKWAAVWCLSPRSSGSCGKPWDISTDCWLNVQKRWNVSAAVWACS